MTMDLIALGIILLCVIICIFRGFILTVIGFFKGVASWIIAWIFCDDLANWILGTAIGREIEEAIGSFITGKFETSEIYDALPDMFKGEHGFLSNEMLSDGAAKISTVTITILCFVLIAIALIVIISLLTAGIRRSKRKAQEDGKKHRLNRLDVGFGAIIGLVLGVAWVCLLFALLVPVVTFIVPSKVEAIMALFNGSIFAKLLYDNNLLLIAIQKFLVH